MFATGALFTGVTIVITGGLLVLLVGSGSIDILLPVAAFDKLPPLAGAITVMVRFVIAPTASVPRLVQTTWLPLTVAVGTALTNVRFVGKLSVTVKLTAGDGPRLVTVIV